MNAKIDSLKMESWDRRVQVSKLEKENNSLNSKLQSLIMMYENQIRTLNS